jgi:hypothetical protein
MFTQILFGRLADGGELLIGNFHPDNPSRAGCEVGLDWHLVYRDEKDMARLKGAIVCKDSQLSKDTQGYVAYLKLIK